MLEEWTLLVLVRSGLGILLGGGRYQSIVSVLAATRTRV
jgi:hypothetical protein